MTDGQKLLFRKPPGDVTEGLSFFMFKHGIILSNNCAHLSVFIQLQKGSYGRPQSCEAFKISVMRTCSDIIIHYFWILLIFIDWQHFWEHQKQIPLPGYNMPQHSPQLHDDSTLKRKNAFWNNKHLKPAHYSGDIVPFQASLNSSSLYNRAHCSPTENLLPSLKST